MSVCVQAWTVSSLARAGKWHMCCDCPVLDV